MITRFVEMKWSVEVGTHVCAEREVVDAVTIVLVRGVGIRKKGWVRRVDRTARDKWMSQINGLKHDGGKY